MILHMAICIHPTVINYKIFGKHVAMCKNLSDVVVFLNASFSKQYDFGH